MAKISTQFHATSDEILNFLKVCSNEYNLHIVVLQFFPTFAVKLLNPINEALNIIPEDKTIQICLYTYKPDLNPENQIEFLDKNPDGLFIDIGKYYDNQLGESSIGTLAIDVNTLKIWKKIIKEFKSNTYTGAWVVNQLSGAKAYYKHHRYTEGAKNLFLAGVKIVPIAGWNYYILSDSI